MNRTKLIRLLGIGVIVAGVGVTGLAGLRAAGAAQEAAEMMPPELGNLPLGRLLKRGVHRLRQLHGELNLTEAQRGEIKGILQSHRGEIVEVAREVRDHHRTLQGAMEAEPLDEAAVREAASALADAIGDAAVLRAKVQREIKAKLTPEQIQKLEDCRADVEQGVDRFLESAGKV